MAILEYLKLEYSCFWVWLGHIFKEKWSFLIEWSGEKRRKYSLALCLRKEPYTDSFVVICNSQFSSFPSLELSHFHVKKNALIILYILHFMLTFTYITVLSMLIESYEKSSKALIKTWLCSWGCLPLSLFKRSESRWNLSLTDWVRTVLHSTKNVLCRFQWSDYNEKYTKWYQWINLW